MSYCVYMLVSENKKNRLLSYVGYAKNVERRILQHNNSKGAKFTRGRKWILCYKKTYLKKNEAMINEYKLKKNKKFRKTLKEKFLRGTFI